MRKYETLMVLHPELPDAQTRETIGRARQLIEGMDGTIQQIQEWGMRDLAYPIRKLSRGYYVLMEYVATPATVNELERNLKIADELLRFLTVAPTAAPREEKPARARESRKSEDSVEAEKGAGASAEVDAASAE